MSFIAMCYDNSLLGLTICGSLGAAIFVYTYASKGTSFALYPAAPIIDSTFVSQFEEPLNASLVSSPSIFQFLSNYLHFTTEPSVVVSFMAKTLLIVSLYKCTPFVCSCLLSGTRERFFSSSTLNYDIILDNIIWVSDISLEFFFSILWVNTYTLPVVVRNATSILHLIQDPPENPVFFNIQSEGENLVVQLGSGDTPNPFGEGIEFTSYHTSMLGLDPSPREQEEETFDFLV